MNKSFEPIPLKDTLSSFPWGDSMQQFAEALQKAIQMEGSVKKLAIKTNISISTIYRIRKQKVYKLTPEVYSKLFGVLCPFLPNNHYIALVSKNEGRKIIKKHIDFL